MHIDTQHGRVLSRPFPSVSRDQQATCICTVQVRQSTQIAINLDTSNAPRTTALVLEAARAKVCSDFRCRFYRNEAAPQVLCLSATHCVWERPCGA